MKISSGAKIGECWDVMFIIKGENLELAAANLQTVINKIPFKQKPKPTMCWCLSLAFCWCDTPHVHVIFPTH